MSCLADWWLSRWPNRRLVPASLAFCAIVAAPAAAQKVDQRQQIMQALASGDTNMVSQLASDDALSDLDRLYIKGLILQRMGDHQSASNVFRAALLARPDQKVMRQSLIVSLVALEEHDSALHHIDILIETESDVAVRRRHQVIRARVLASRPYGFSFGFSLAPSTNVNRATTAEEVDVDGFEHPLTLGETASSGVGANLSISGFRRFSVGEKNTLQFNVALASTIYDDPQFNRGSTTVALSYTRPDDAGYWRLGTAFSRNLFDNQINNHFRHSVTGRREWQRSETQILGFTLTGHKTDFDAPENDQYDAVGFGVSADLRRRLNDRYTFNTSLGYRRELTQDDRFAYNNYRLGVGLGRNWASGWQSSVGLHFERRQYDEPLSDFFDFEREDNRVGADASIANVNFRIFNAVPRIGCSASRTTSNLFLYDDRNVFECNLSLSQKF